MTGLAAPLLLRLPFLGKVPWKLVGIAAVMIAALWWHLAGVNHARVEGRAEVQRKWDAETSARKTATIATYERQLATLRAQLATQQADSTALADKLSAADDLSLRLQTALSRAKLVTHEPNPAASGCPVVRLSSAFRVCINAAITGSGEATANCEAVGVPAAGAAEPGYATP